MNVKRIILGFIFLSLAFVSQAQTRIEQIQSASETGLFSVQSQNQQDQNKVIVNQLGNYNTVSVEQSNSSEFEKANQAILLQEGNQNQTDMEQEGSRNSLISLQLGYLSTRFSTTNPSPLFEVLSANFSLVDYVFGDLSSSDRNTIVSKQEGSNNGLISLQVGSDNYMSASQMGQNNYLVATQIGQFNHLLDFKQENQSSSEFLLESITQLGRNNLIEFSGTIKGQIYGNSYKQSGENLALKLNTSLITSLGGMEITQTGHDMTIVIDQSYFSFPMK
ncbi:hypothetical protein [Sunxiuqinia indica]|uniref:hypothetical protein n=1 Tax=Sunxiuqinia indica TaxID=2692584 RepID=UPI0013581B97|nr:hypothetical protein [Sunxiuqinia indica]